MPVLSIANVALYAAQITVIVALLGLMFLLPAVRVPQVRLALGHLILLAIVLLPLQCLWLANPVGPVAAEEVTAAVRFDAGTLDVGAAAGAGWTRALGAVLVMGIAVRLAWMAIGVLRLHLRTRRATSRPLPGDVRDLLARVGTDARIHFADDVAAAVTYGIWPPVILLPAALLDAPPARRRAVVCHELLHVQRRDWLWVMAEELVRSVLWFHPAVWWLVREIQVAREEVVDARTVAITGERRVYLDTLLESMPSSGAAAAVPGFLRSRQLARRIASLCQEVPMSRVRTVMAACLVTAALGFGTAAAVSAWPMQARAMVTPPPPGQVPDGPPAPAVIDRVEVAFPSEAATPDVQEVAVGVRAEIDANGIVADTKIASFRIRTNDGDSAASSSGDLMAMVDGTTTPPAGQDRAAAAAMVHASQLRAMFTAARDAISRWRFQPPAAAPHTVMVDVTFQPSQSRVYTGTPRTLITIRNVGPSTPAGAVRVGGAIAPPKKVHHVNPVYPEAAKAAGIGGVVVIEATIGADGTVIDTRVLRSVDPELDEAALAAVRQWRYQPTLLNGAPVPVIMTLTVNFTLRQG